MCVLFGHTFIFLDEVGYALWAGMQVPLFVLIQSFHAFKQERGDINIKKIFRRVFLPFLIVQILTICLALLFTKYTWNSLINKMLSNGGFGPGAYYPWIYIQVAFILPFFHFLFQKCNKLKAFLITFVLCEGLEVLLSVIDFPDSAYRLLFIRYIFLFVLGWIWVKEGVKVNWLSIVLSIISLITIIYFEYYSTNDEPWFYLTNWKYHRWPCYFFVSHGLVVLLYILWCRIKQFKSLQKCVTALANASYEIFLVQMMTLFFFHSNALSFIGDKIIQYFIWLIIVWIISIAGGIVFHMLISFFSKQKCPSR